MTGVQAPDGGAPPAARRVGGRVECRAVAEEIVGQVLHDLLELVIVDPVAVREEVRAVQMTPGCSWGLQRG